jgi:hypothetical protein
MHDLVTCHVDSLDIKKELNLSQLGGMAVAACMKGAKYQQILVRSSNSVDVIREALMYAGHRVNQVELRTGELGHTWAIPWKLIPAGRAHHVRVSSVTGLACPAKLTSDCNIVDWGSAAGVLARWIKWWWTPVGWRKPCYLPSTVIVWRGCVHGGCC